MADETAEKILNRLKSVEGHVRGVQRMVTNGEYCVDIMNQTLAIQRALHKVNGMVLDRHMHTCAAKAIRGKDLNERERVIGEILNLFAAQSKL